MSAVEIATMDKENIANVQTLENATTMKRLDAQLDKNDPNLPTKKKTKPVDNYIDSTNILPSDSRRSRRRTKFLNLDTFDDSKETYDEIEFSTENYDKLFKEQIGEDSENDNSGVENSKKSEKSKTWEEEDDDYNSDDLAKDQENEEDSSDSDIDEEVDEAEASEIESEDDVSEDEFGKQILASYKNNGVDENSADSEEDEDDDNTSSDDSA